MHIVPIPPTQNIPDFAGFQWQFCLTHIASKNPTYLDYYRKMPGKIILDNGAFETGQADNFQQVLEIAKEVQAYEVVLPDRMFMADETIQRSKEAFDYFSAQADFYTIPSLQAVVHGRNIKEWRDCAEELAGIGIDTLAIPKDYEAWDGGRDILLDLLLNVKYRGGYSFKIHLLGMEKDVHAHSHFEGIQEIRSMDTAKPFIYAFYGYTFPLRNEWTMPHKFTRPRGYFDKVKLEGDKLSMAAINMGRWHTYVGH